MSTQSSTSSTSAVRNLRLVSILETLSFLVLLGMMIARSESGVSITGAIHGSLFLGYALLILKDREVFGWSWGFAALAILTGPVGAIIVLEKLRN